MTYQYYNPNPTGQKTDDCVVRALTLALNTDWYNVYWTLSHRAAKKGTWGDRLPIWSSLLRDHGFKRYAIPNYCPDCYTFEDFALDHQKGVYVIATNTHVAAVKDGVIFDAWDSRKEVPAYYFEKELR